MKNNFRRIFDIVSAKNDGKGSIVQFSISANKDNNEDRCVFVTGAKQKPDTNSENARFDYENGQKMKLGPADIGAIMSVLRMREDSINNGKGLYHQHVSGGETIASSIKMKKNDPKYGGFFFEMKKKDMALALPITNANAEVMYCFLQTALFYIYGE